MGCSRGWRRVALSKAGIEVRWLWPGREGGGEGQGNEWDRGGDKYPPWI